MPDPDPNRRWFDNYAGPKELGWEGEFYVCALGANVPCGDGMRGVSVVGTGNTPGDAIVDARRRLAEVVGGSP